MTVTKQAHPLRDWRKANGVTLHALAEHLGVTQSHLSEVENWNNTPSLELAARLHEHTGIDMKAFVRRPESVQ